MKKIIICILLYLVTYGAIAKPPGGNGEGLSIDTSLSPYANLTNVVGTNNNSDEEIQIAGATQVAAVYRLKAGLNSLTPGTTFKIIWQDGSSESVLVVSSFSSIGVTPIPGSQKAAGASGGGSIGGGGGTGGGTGSPVGGGGGSGGGYVYLPDANGGEWGCVSTDGNQTWGCTWFPDS
jgi:hypothetical protein